jgi:hypothetical protein
MLNLFVTVITILLIITAVLLVLGAKYEMANNALLWVLVLDTAYEKFYKK